LRGTGFAARLAFPMARTKEYLAASKRRWRSTLRGRLLYAQAERRRLHKKNLWRRRRNVAGKALAFRSFREFFEFYDPVSVVTGAHLTDPVFVVLMPSGKRVIERLTDPLPEW
jgi:hypothetical protein